MVQSKQYQAAGPAQAAPLLTSRQAQETLEWSLSREYNILENDVAAAFEIERLQFSSCSSAAHSTRGDAARQNERVARRFCSCNLVQLTETSRSALQRLQGQKQAQLSAPLGLGQPNSSSAASAAWGGSRRCKQALTCHYRLAHQAALSRQLQAAA